MTAALTGKLPDRVPFLPTIFTDHACIAAGRQFEDALINPGLGAQSMLEAALRYQTDGVRFLPGPPTDWYDQKRVEFQDNVLVQVDRRSDRVEGYFDVAGGGKFISHHPPKAVSKIADVAETHVLTAEEYRQQGYFKDVAPLIEKAHSHDLFVVGMASSQTLNFMVEQMGDAEAAIMTFFDDPELALALIDRAVQISLEKARAFIDVGVDCIYIGDSYASGSVISPEIYQRFCAPAYRETAAEIHRMGVLCYKHCCGDYNPLLVHLPETGIDGMDGIDPTSGMSVAHTKAIVGDTITLMGGISCLNLLNGTPEDVYAEAAACIEDGKPGGRYILGSACAVPRFSPPENLLAARQAAVELGGY